ATPGARSPSPGGGRGRVTSAARGYSGEAIHYRLTQKDAYVDLDAMARQTFQITLYNTVYMTRTQFGCTLPNTLERQKTSQVRQGGEQPCVSLHSVHCRKNPWARPPRLPAGRGAR